MITILGKLLIHVCPCHRTIYFGTGQRAVTLCSCKGNCSPSTYSKVCPMNQWRRSVIKYGGGVRVSQVKPSNSQITPSVNDFQTLITVIGKKLWFCDFYQQSRFLTAYRRPKISFTFHFDTGLSFLMLWNLQSYPTTVFNEIMWHFTGVKTDSDSSFKFSVGRDPLPAPGSASLQWICSSAYRREMTVVRDTVQQPFQHIFCNYTPCFIKNDHLLKSYVSVIFLNNAGSWLPAGTVKLVLPSTLTQVFHPWCCETCRVIQQHNCP